MHTFNIICKKNGINTMHFPNKLSYNAKSHHTGIENNIQNIPIKYTRHLMNIVCF